MLEMSLHDKLWPDVPLGLYAVFSSPMVHVWVCSAPSCDHFGHHGEWKKYLVIKILAKVANWRPTDLKRYLFEKLSKIGRI